MPLQNSFPNITPQLDSLLKELLDYLPKPITLAEVMLYIPQRQRQPACFVTLALKPDSAPVLPTRLPADDGVAKEVLRTFEPIGGSTEDISAKLSERIDDPSAAKMRHFRLQSTCSALVIPVLTQTGAGRRAIQPQALGLVNLESSDESLLHDGFVASLQHTITKIARALEAFPKNIFEKDSDIASFLFEKIKRELLFILDPDELIEVYRQIRQAAERLTSAADSHVAATILLRRQEALNLGLANNDRVGGSYADTWIHPVATASRLIQITEWDLDSIPSLTREAMTRHGSVQAPVYNPVYIPDVSTPEARRRRKEMPKPYDQGSELVLPLYDGPDAFGVLSLVSTRKNAFSDADLRLAEEIATYLAVVTKRIEKFRKPMRLETQRQQAFHLEVMQLIDKLSALTNFVEITEIRDEALKKIAQEAKLRTGSGASAIVLAERKSGSSQEVELVWNTTYFVRDLARSEEIKDEQLRFPTTKGLVGRAYTTEKLVNEPDVSIAVGYEKVFESVRSELVIPLPRKPTDKRDTDKMYRQRGGVIDLESSLPAHYTAEHQSWAEFLAGLVVTVLQAVERATRRWFETRLAEIEDETAYMRESQDLVKIQNARRPMLQKLIDEARLMTRATIAQIYVVVNAHTSSATPPNAPVEGGLGAIIASREPDRTASPNQPALLHHHIGLTEGMAGNVVRTGITEFFKDANDKPDHFLPNGLDTQSALVVPIKDGNRVIAILNMESERPRWCSDFQLAIAEYTAQLAANILVAYRISMERIQANMLLQFEPIHIESPNVTTYLKQALNFADRLTNSALKQRWGQIVLVQDDQIAYTLSCDFGAATDPYTDSSERRPIECAVYRQVCHPPAGSKPQAYLIPNMADTDVSNLQLWDKANCLLCVPLLHRERSDSPVVIGLLTMAASQPYYLNDGDREALCHFARIITHGLLDIARLYSRVTLMYELHNAFNIFQIGHSPSELQALHEEILAIPDASDPKHAARVASERYNKLQESFLLNGHLPEWNLVLSNFYPVAPISIAKDGQQKPFVGDIIQDLKPVIEAYTYSYVKSRVDWRWEPTNQERRLSNLRFDIPGGDLTETMMLKAALFGAISMAVVAVHKAHQDGHQINVCIARESRDMLRVRVEYRGRAIPDKWRERFPRFHYDQSSGINTMEEPERRLIEVSRIIERWKNGCVRILPINPDQNAAIELLIPYIEHIDP